MFCPQILSLRLKCQLCFFLPTHSTIVDHLLFVQYLNYYHLRVTGRVGRVCQCTYTCAVYNIVNAEVCEFYVKKSSLLFEPRETFGEFAVQKCSNCTHWHIRSSLKPGRPTTIDQVRVEYQSLSHLQNYILLPPLLGVGMCLLN
jgi:hypothetical protein